MQARACYMKLYMLRADARVCGALPTTVQDSLILLEDRFDASQNGHASVVCHECAGILARLQEQRHHLVLLLTVDLNSLRARRRRRRGRERSSTARS